MEMGKVEIERFLFHLATREKLRFNPSYVPADTGIQDTTVVFTNRKQRGIEDSICYELTLSVPWRHYTDALIHNRANPWYSVFDRIHDFT